MFINDCIEFYIWKLIDSYALHNHIESRNIPYADSPKVFDKNGKVYDMSDFIQTYEFTLTCNTCDVERFLSRYCKGKNVIAFFGAKIVYNGFIIKISGLQWE